MNKIFQVDAFADAPFKGNPAGVVLLAKGKDDRWMQLLAREMNLSETAFLLGAGSEYNLRWFTPAVEVDLCGHATLASAHVLFSEGLADPGEGIVFHSRSGKLGARSLDGWVELDFPSFDLKPVQVTGEIERALGFKPDQAFHSDVNLLVEVASLEEVEGYFPKLDLLKELDFQGLIITSRMDSGGFDFASRYFAPQLGIDEDPVTGSAHCTLAPYWSRRLGKTEFRAYQASERGGVLKVRLRDEGVLISGQAVTIFSGELRESNR